MEGMMMNMPLRISSILEFAKTSYPEVEIISKMSSGEVHRTNYRDISIRSKKMANALLELKVSLGTSSDTLKILSSELTSLEVSDFSPTFRSRSTCSKCSRC